MKDFEQYMYFLNILDTANENSKHSSLTKKKISGNVDDDNLLFTVYVHCKLFDEHPIKMIKLLYLMKHFHRA